MLDSIHSLYLDTRNHILLEGGGGFLKGEEVIQVIDMKKWLLFAWLEEKGFKGINLLHSNLFKYEIKVLKLL